MSEPEGFLFDTGFTGVYSRLIETYRMEPAVLVEQFDRIMARMGELEASEPRKRKKRRGENPQ